MRFAQSGACYSHTRIASVAKIEAAQRFPVWQGNIGAGFSILQLLGLASQAKVELDFTKIFCYAMRRNGFGTDPVYDTDLTPIRSAGDPRSRSAYDPLLLPENETQPERVPSKTSTYDPLQ